MYARKPINIKLRSNMAKKKNTSRAVSPQQTPEPLIPDNSLDVGPEVSPYSSSSCTVYFKGGRQFIIPYDLLRSSKKLEEIYGGWCEIRLRDIPDEAGHVLIHYLHTGTWQTLRVNNPTPAVVHSTQLNISLHVYAAAQAYELPDLAELAKGKISHYAGLLPDLETLVLASDAGRLIGEDDLWFSAFIRLRIRQLFEDPASLNKTRFLGCFDSATTYTRMLAKGLIDICCDKSTSVNPTASQPTSQFEVYAASESGREPVVGLFPVSTPTPSMGATKHESESAVILTPESETARSAYSAQPKPESAVEVLPEPEAAPLDVAVELKPGSAIDCTPVPLTEPDLKKKKLTKKEKKRLERKKERFAAATATLEQAAEPEPGLLIDAAEPSAESAVHCLLGTEVAPIDAAEPEPEPEPIPDLDWQAEPSSEPAGIEAEPSAEIATELQPDSWAEPNPEPNPEPAVETEEFPYAQPKKGKKKDTKGKKGGNQDVCVWKATHLVDGGWESCFSCRQYVGNFVSSYHQSKENSALGM
ncbi:hypothetical protein CDEST_01969 [Colletotrichum destructivum]|uniref:BTB domain-containing protein n=1 Tax=Colletotrichum destructivum TaxID=34406 RepID=A0AAX4I132_9PEZI|nr:hypothetical protein CDEST_01969 [Colletotrichum destructivum]